jgi:hypothetical protein
MPESSMAATPPRPGSKAPKLRSSCDCCGTAKVKCDHSHPECGRCATLSLTCVYGLSRKFGKPPRKRPGVNLDAPTEKRICTSWTTDSRDNHTITGFGEPQIVNECLPANFPDFDIFPFSYGKNEQNQLTSALYPSLPLEGWLPLDNFETGLEIPSISALNPASTVGTSSNSHESHSCPRESYEIFRDLICPSPFLHAPESNSVTVSAQLDQVLHFNRNAIDRLGRLLKCPCAKSGHRAMVHASIVSRLLIWYQQAAGWTGSSSWGARPSTIAEPSCRVSSSASPMQQDTGTSTTISPSLVQATGFAVEHVPVSMGSFSIEDQNVQAVFRNQLVLCELKKTAKLIDIFISQDSGESTASGLAGLYSHLGAWLRSEHSRTVRILRSRLSALNEKLES